MLGIAVTGYSSFGGLSYQAFNPSAESLLESQAIKDIAKKHNASPAQVLHTTKEDLDCL